MALLWGVLLLVLMGSLLGCEAANSMSRNTCVGVTVNTQPIPAVLSSCCWYDSSTCCSNYIQTLTFPSIEQATQTIFKEPGITPGCFSALSAVLCAVCSPSTTSFVQIGYTGTTTFDLDIAVCNSTCARAHTECGGVVPGNNEPLDTPELFCRALFEEAQNVQMPGLALSFRLDNSNCFDMPPLEVVQNATCMAQYFHSTPNNPAGSGMVTGQSPPETPEHESSPPKLSPWRIVGMGLGVTGVGLACGAWFLYQKKPAVNVNRLNLFKQLAGVGSESESSTDSEDKEEEKSSHETPSV